MPKPIDIFLHTYKIDLAKKATRAGGWISGLSVPAIVGGATATTVAAEGLLIGGIIAGIGGLSLMLIPAAYGLKKVLGRKNRQEFSEKGQKLSTEDFDNIMDWDCYWKTVTVVGYGRTGKTQLKKRLRGHDRLRGADCPTTTNLEIHLSCLDQEAKTYIALLDYMGADSGGSGEQKCLINKAKDKANIIILVLDHANTEKYGNNADLSEDRLRVQESFIHKTLISNLKKDGYSNNLQAIMVVMNKADVWESKECKEKIKDWTQKKSKLLERELSCSVSTYYLSAEIISHPGYSYFKQELNRLCKIPIK